MLKSLKYKFIAITMISVTAVFVLILSTINIVNYTNVVKNANAKLTLLADNNGTFQGLQKTERDSNGNAKDQNGEPAKPDGNTTMQGEPAMMQNNNATQGNPAMMQNGEPPAKPDGEGSATQNNRTGSTPFDKETKDASPMTGFVLNNSSINEETPFETRYFNVVLTTSGEYVSCNVDNIAAVSANRAISIAQELFADGSKEGTYDNYMYKQIDSDGNVMYIFLDNTRDLSSFRSFLMISIIIAVVGIILVFILSTILSKMALKPVFESYAKQKRFITDASHELKTPVAIISADVEIIEMENGESEWTKSIEKQTNRLTNLTEQMVLLSRMDEGVGNKEFTTVNASEVFKEVSESFEPMAVKLNKTFNIYIDAGITVKGDEKNLSQMLSLLIDNAFKYSDENGRIDVTFHKNPKGKVLKVYNTVDEITVGNHDELFGRFYRRDESRNSKTGGFGIGLSVVNAIAESHKAKASAYSADDKSIEFKIVF
ncbi:MAG: HAMP domain-containing histidine kinase [Lachnospiraceae bacterium]|nr:HAMP domain-containing histidine kinase [Lachnospiraceae bacterium]